MDRDKSLLGILDRRRPFDVAVIGGGATGAGIALDAASRNLDVLLLERDDFGKGTSSRSTKIIHGGVRYLAQGRIGLVREALRERAYLLQNAPHLVSPLAFFVPIENAFQCAKYFIGLKLYDMLAGKQRVDSCSWFGRTEFSNAVRVVHSDRYSGAIRYFDAHFDDTRLLINILATAVSSGAIILNYAEVVGLNKNNAGRLKSISFHDRESGQSHEVEAQVVVNATGAASDNLLKLDQPSHVKTILHSQGTHVVVAKEFLPEGDALLMPQTPDGRIMFAIPWLDHVLIGSTDTPLIDTLDDPIPQDEEIEIILKVTANYLRRAPVFSDILSSFAGIRPLVRASTNSKTSKASREHRIDTLPSGLVSISGGKWTTYRLMAAQCVDMIAAKHNWHVRKSQTQQLPMQSTITVGTSPSRFVNYGKHANELEEMINDDRTLDEPLCEHLPYKKVHCVWAIRREMARTIEDVLARRTRALFLNAKSARKAAPIVLDLLMRELNIDAQTGQLQLESFEKLARIYCQN